jgi:hypothetical protein
VRIARKNGIVQKYLAPILFRPNFSMIKNKDRKMLLFPASKEVCRLAKNAKDPYAAHLVPSKAEDSVYVTQKEMDDIVSKDPDNAIIYYDDLRIYEVPRFPRLHRLAYKINHKLNSLMGI